jgi:rhodanese-related sulfurtransferase
MRESYDQSHGFDDVHPLVGGLDTWVDAGLPVKPK